MQPLVSARLAGIFVCAPLAAQCLLECFACLACSNTPACCRCPAHLASSRSPFSPLPPCPCCSKPGYYSSAPRAGSCLLCPIGKQCPLSATAVPQTCGKGYFSSTEGARLCTPCPVNTYQPGTSPTQCVRCADGYNTRGLTGQSRCQVVRSRPLRLAMF